jgi:hypothetical protein
MNSRTSAFEYDEFERYLLDAASIDRAPSDLPARLGAALGLSVPVLVATEAASLIPTTTSLAGSGTGTATVASGSYGLPAKGLLAAVKSALGVGASTLWNTAAKGIAVGLISGSAILGTSRAVAWVASSSETVSALPARVAQAQSQAAAAVPARNESEQGVTPSLFEDEQDRDRDEQKLDADAPEKPAPAAESHNFYRSRAPMSWVSPAGNGSAPEVEDDKPVKRRARRIFPEKTTAIARFPLLFDDTELSAFYDTPKRAAIAPTPPTAAPEPVIDPTLLVSLRAKTVQRARVLLGQSKAAAALSELDGFRHHVGERNFGLDELLLHIEALAMLGRAKEAQADVAVVERIAPNSAALRQAQQLARSRFVR